VQLANSDDVPVRLILGVDAAKAGCNKRKPREATEAAKWATSGLFPTVFLKMGASTAGYIWQIAESIPELHGRRTFMKYRLLGKSGLAGLRSGSRHYGPFRRRVGMGDHRRLKRKRFMRPTARPAETSLTQRISTPTAPARNSWVSSFRAIARSVVS